MASCFTSIFTLLSVLTLASSLAVTQKERSSRSRPLVPRNPAVDVGHHASNLTERVTWCFEPTPAKSYPVNLDMCNLALESIIKRDGVDEFYKSQIFWQGKDAPKGAHTTPDRWTINLSVSQYCEIVLQANQPGQTDRFRLLDVAAAGQRILNECIGPGRHNLGGGSDVGDELGFSVYVIGQKFPSEPALYLTSPLTLPSNETGLAIQPTKTEKPPPNKVLGCFEPTNSRVWPVNPETCELGLEFMIRRDGAEEFVKEQTFWQGPGAAPGFHTTPDSWPVDVDDNFCNIVLSARENGAQDTFSLVQVAAAVQEVIDQCVRQSKSNLGGGLEFGTKGFFVAVNGRAPRSVGVSNSTLSISDVAQQDGSVETFRKR